MGKSYNVYRDGQLIAEGLTNKAFTDNTVAPSTSYEYKVTEVVDGKETAVSEATTVKTKAKKRKRSTKKAG